jgi:hypothetical protein
VNPANPNLDIVSFGLRIVFHDVAQPIRWTTPRPFLAPSLKCSPFLYDALFHIDSSPLNRSVSCELTAALVTQWKAYAINTSLICTTG